MLVKIWKYNQSSHFTFFPAEKDKMTKAHFYFHISHRLGTSEIIIIILKIIWATTYKNIRFDDGSGDCCLTYQ